MSQMIFETIPQIFLQVRIFFYFYNNQETNQDISLGTLFTSIVFAFSHGLLEVLVLKIESEQFDLPLTKYFIICFNGRLGWVPMLDKLKSSKVMQQMVQDEEILDFDDLKTTFCMMEIGVQFLFSDQTAETLAQSIYKMKTIEDEKSRPTLRIGQCMTHINFESLMKVLDYSTMKVIIQIDNVPVKQMMMAS